MATDGFNPYHAWLGLDRQLTRPSHYQLLGLPENVADPQQIAVAADAAATRVRSIPPGPYATQWVQVLNEISAAQRCLTDPAQRAAYDRQLQERRVAGAPPVQRPAPRGAVPVFTPPAAAPLPGAPAPWPPAPPAAASPTYAPGPTMPPAPAAPLGGGPVMPYPGMAPGMPHPAPLGRAPLAPGQYPGVAGPYPAAPAPGYGLPPTMPTAPAAPLPPRPAFGMPQATGPWPVMPGLAARGVPPMAAPPAGAPVAATPAAAEPTAADTPDAEVAAATAPTAKRRAAAIRAKKDESRSKLFALLITLSGALVLLIAVAILALVASRSDDKPKGHTRLGEHPVTPPTPTPQNKMAKPAEGTQKPGSTPKRPPTGRPDRRFSVPTGGEWKPWPDGPGKKGKDESIPPLSGIDELAPKPGETPGESRPGPDGTKMIPGVSPSTDDPAKEKLDPPGMDTKDNPQKPVSAKLDGGDSATATDTAKSVPKPDTKPDEDATPQPKPTEVRNLAKALQSARDALSDYRFDRAKSELEKVKGVPMLPQHQAKYQRLELLTQYAEKFQAALADAVKSLSPGTNIRLASTEVGVVQATKDSLTVRVAGQNKTYRLGELSPTLALAIADQFIDQKGSGAPAFKAAFVVTHKNASEDLLGKAREWLKTAKQDGADIRDLEQVIDDQYDLEQDLPKSK